MSHLRSADIAYGPAKPLVRDIVSKRKALIRPREGWSPDLRGRISFDIPPSSNEYLSSDFKLHLIYTVTQADGTNIPAGAVCHSFTSFTAVQTHLYFRMLQRKIFHTSHYSQTWN